jgi:hypothetical protein
MKASIMSLFAAAVAVSAIAIPDEYPTEYPVESYPASTSTAAPYVSSTSVYEYPVSSSTAEGYPVKTSAPYVSSSTSCTEGASSTYSAYPISSSKAAEYTTSVYETTVMYTVTKCPATVTNCPASYTSVTSSVYKTTTVCPVETTKAYPVASSSYVSKPYTTSANAGYPTSKAAAPVLSTMTISTCVPSYITSVVTVYPTTTSKAAHTAAPSTYPTSKNSTVLPFTGAASAQKAGGLLMAVGLFAAML